jgi:hypothetical protein
MVLDVTNLTLIVILATLAAIVYMLRVMVLMERRIARMEDHVEKIANRILAEELRIERSMKSSKKQNVSPPTY